MFFLLTSISLSSNNFQIILKIDNQVVTTYDLEQERNYLLALNPRLYEVDEKTLLLAKVSGAVESGVQLHIHFLAPSFSKDPILSQKNGLIYNVRNLLD